MADAEAAAAIWAGSGNVLAKASRRIDRVLAVDQKAFQAEIDRAFDDMKLDR